MAVLNEFRGPHKEPRVSLVRGSTSLLGIPFHFLFNAEYKLYFLIVYSP